MNPTKYMAKYENAKRFADALEALMIVNDKAKMRFDDGLHIEVSNPKRGVTGRLTISKNNLMDYRGSGEVNVDLRELMAHLRDKVRAFTISGDDKNIVLEIGGETKVIPQIEDIGETLTVEALSLMERKADIIADPVELTHIIKKLTADSENITFYISEKNVILKSDQHDGVIIRKMVYDFHVYDFIDVTYPVSKVLPLLAAGSKVSDVVILSFYEEWLELAFDLAPGVISYYLKRFFK